MIDKNLFLYDLAVVAIFKDEGRYLKEWLDYHLLAGVEHFYLYNNNSSDDYAEVLAPYIEQELVTLTNLPGKTMQTFAYNDAVEKYRFECRYMAFIDLDEFIFPKSNRAIVDIVDESLSKDKNATGLGINWQCFGSNGQKKADYSRGVLERFTSRAPSNWDTNKHVKTIVNPRFVSWVCNPHYATYFEGKFNVNSSGGKVDFYSNVPVLFDKIVVNHYNIKSREEYTKRRIPKGWACPGKSPYGDKHFEFHDRNEVFDDGILKYRAARAENFSFESEEHRVNRVVNSLVQTLTQPLPADNDRKFFVDKLETFLTCRAVAEKFQITIGDTPAEEMSLDLIYRRFINGRTKNYFELYQMIKALPEILVRPFPICKKIKDSMQNDILPEAFDWLNVGQLKYEISTWMARSELFYMQKLLRLIKL